MLMVRMGSAFWRQCARRAAASWSTVGMLTGFKVLPSRSAITEIISAVRQSFAWANRMTLNFHVRSCASIIQLVALERFLYVFMRIPQSNGSAVETACGCSVFREEPVGL